MSSVDNLKEEIQALKGKLNRDPTAVDDCNTCLLYVRLKHSLTEPLTEALLESKLQTKVLEYDIIRTKPTSVFRVKIAKALLHNALTHARAHDCIADLWGGSHCPSRRISADVPMPINSSTAQQSLTISCWNCRGWATGASYLDHMVQGGSDVIVISEHWLWPYELHKLDKFNSQYRGMGKSDPRLTEASDISARGCGGVGILWRKSFDVTPISDIRSNRICGIRIKRSTENDQSWISILGVYLPCLDLGAKLYHDSLVELERVVSESEQLGPVIIAGDFNAHLGPMWGPRANKSPNIQGVLLGEVLDRCKLHAVSLGDSVSGPDYTYLSGNSSTIVDYILADVEATSCIETCKVLEDIDQNTSDHLALSVTLSCDVPTQFAKDPNWIRIDWTKARKSGAILKFQSEVSNRLKPFTKRSRGNIEHIDKEISHVAWLITDAAHNTLPLVKPRKVNKFKDKTLSQLCARSKEAWRAWCSEGRPASGPLYNAKCMLRRQVRQRVKFCAATEERRRVYQQDSLFGANSHLRFRIPQKRSKSGCTRLQIDDALVSDPSLLLEAWAEHFQNLAKPQENTNPALKESIEQCVTLLSTSFQKEEVFLDVAFNTEEVDHAVNKLKIKKSAGPDNLTAEHLKYGGNSIIVWLTEILNAIVDMEQIPACLKLGITIPIYKGRGKDPLNTNSYRGITINSAISKVLETLILDRLEPLFMEAGVPHPNQLAYRKSVSCADAIFATQEVINRYLLEGGKVYMCLYDLEKAYDSVKFSVLLKRLFQVGVNSKTWRILRTWYTDGHSSVRLGQHVSPPFALGRGVHQGSILSPALFLLIMDPLLRQLQSLSIAGAETPCQKWGGSVFMKFTIYRNFIFFI